MSFLGRLLGSEEVIDGMKKGIDAVVFTDQERADRFERLLKLYEPFKIAQRAIALVVVPTYVLICILCIMLELFTGIDTEVAKEYLNGDFGTMTQLVVGFYFAGGMINTLRK